MTNIIFFVTVLDSGGLENYLLRFLNHKARSFDKIIVFCKGGTTGQLEQKFNSIPNVIIHCKKLRFFNPLDYLYVYHFLKKHNVNSVCDFTGNYAGLVLYTAKLAKIKKRISFYRGSTNHFKESKLKLLYDTFVKKLTYKYATNILSNSMAAFDFFYRDHWRANKRFKVIYNGINSESIINEKNDLRIELNIPEDAFVIGHTGRYNKYKNHETIINVAFELCKKNKDIYFLLCGNGVKDNLEKIIKEKELQNRIITLNNREDISKVLKTLDCYYFPSISEGQPNALLEAMIAGLPFVTSNIDSIKETVPKLSYEFLVEPNDVNGAVEKLNLLIGDVELRNKMNFSSWAIINFDPDKLFNKFYQEL